MFTQSDLKTEKNNVNLHLKLHIVHDIPHCKFYLYSLKFEWKIRRNNDGK